MIRYEIAKTVGVHYQWVIEQDYDWMQDSIEERRESLLEVEEWCVNYLPDNLRWYLSWEEGRIYLAEDTDALAFKMRWC
jgi:hypothetical protein